MNYLLSLFGYTDIDNLCEEDGEIEADTITKSKKELSSEIDFIQYSCFDTIIENTNEPNKIYVHVYTSYRNNNNNNNLLKLEDETIIHNDNILNPIHFVTELVKSYNSDSHLDSVLIADLTRSEVILHYLNNNNTVKITTLQEFKTVLSPYDNYCFVSSKTGNNQLVNLTLSKLIMTFSNQVSQAPLMEYAYILHKDKQLINVNDGLVNYDIIFNQTTKKIILQSSVTKRLVTNVSTININDSEMIFSINIILNLDDTKTRHTFTVDSIKFTYYNASN